VLIFADVAHAVALSNKKYVLTEWVHGFSSYPAGPRGLAGLRVAALAAAPRASNLPPLRRWIPAGSQRDRARLATAALPAVPKRCASLREVRRAARET